MEYSVIEKYEYKSPCYQLHDRSYPVSAQWKSSSRFEYDSQQGVYRSKAADKEQIHLLFAGDLLCQENMLRSYRIKKSYDFSLCFEYLRPLLRSVDFAAGNLETPVSHTAPYRGEIITHEGPFYCNAPLKYLEAVAYAGFDLLYTANNHALDAGARGLMETIENTRKFGLIQTGTFAEETDKFIVVDICGFRVGFAAFSVDYNSMEENLTPLGKQVLLNSYSPESARQIYQAMKERGAEYIVCFPHWGEHEYTDTVEDVQRSMARELSEIGYDLIAGSHAHVIQEADVVNGKPVLYGLGSLISHLNVKSADKDSAAYSLLYSLKLTRQEGQIVAKTEAIPCRILVGHEDIPYTVVPLAEGLDYPELLQEKLQSVGADAAALIKSDSLPVLVDHPVSEAEAQQFQTARAEIPRKVAALLPPPKKKIGKLEPIVTVTKKRGGVYVIYEDHAEMVSFRPSPTSGSFSPPSYINDKPVTVYCSVSTGNAVTRLVYLPEKLQILGPGMFRNYTALESVRTFDGLKTICEGAFDGCTALMGLIMPATLETIGPSAFRGCRNLLSVKLPGSVCDIAPNAFEGCDKLTIFCEEGSYADHYARIMKIPVKYMPLANTASEN